MTIRNKNGIMMYLITTTSISLIATNVQAGQTFSFRVQHGSAEYSNILALIKSNYQDQNIEIGAISQPSAQVPESLTATQGAKKSDSSELSLEPSNTEATSNAETIVVTGSNIRGADKPVGGQLITIDRQAIQRSGFSSIRDISEHLPQNFGSGATGEYQVNAGSEGNNAAGATFNLRGLGQTATLSLINGRRVPSGGTSASVADISTVPLAAIERVEVLPDGASAVYGSDAVAGVVNIILRSDFEGQETTARYGFTSQKDNLDEFQFSHVAGKSWPTGNAFISYEFYHRDQLLKKDRPYSASLDLRSFGGGDYRIPFGSPGNILTPSGGLVVLFALPPNQNGQNLTRADLLPPNSANYYNFWGDTVLFPRKRQNSLFGHFEQEISDSIELYIEGRYAHRKNREAKNSPLLLVNIPPENPYWFDAYGTGEPVRVAYSLDKFYKPKLTGKVKSYNTIAGLNISHPSDWMTRPYVAYSEDKIRVRYDTYSFEGVREASNSTDPNNALNPFVGRPANASEVLQLISDRAHDRTDARIIQANVVSDGPISGLFGQSVRGAIGFDYRHEKFIRDAETNKDGSFAASTFKREVIAVFGELRAPLVNAENALPGMEKLDLSFSIRYDDYRDSAKRPINQKRPSQSTTNPRAGASWSVVEGVQLNGSYGTSFRAPQLETLATVPSVSAVPYEDSLSPTGQSYILLISGVDPDIKSETADTWSFGIELNPAFAPQARIQVNYFNIDFKNQVALPATPSIILNDEGFSDLVVREPSLSQILAACNTAPPSQRPSDPLACTTGAGIDAIVDYRITNLARTKIDGIDVHASYVFETMALGQILLSTNSTILFSYEQAISDNLTPIERKSTPTYPVNFRSRGNISWSLRDDANISLFVNYTNDYNDPDSNKKIDAWTTVDLTMNYNTSNNTNNILLRNVSLQLSIQNLFDQDPPFYDSSSAAGYDYANADPLGRLISFSLKKNW